MAIVTLKKLEGSARTNAIARNIDPSFKIRTVGYCPYNGEDYHISGHQLRLAGLDTSLLVPECSSAEGPVYCINAFACNAH